jgi:murein DD-endopeptidase MepM/ murein hydrolase activator NlpD
MGENARQRAEASFEVRQKMNRIHVLLLGIAGGVLLGFMIWGPHLYKRGPDPLPAHFADAHLARLPFDGEWFVMWGGDEEWQNVPHHGRLSQNLALDLHRVIGPDARTFQGDKTKNESYLCWGQPIYAPTDGTVEIVIDGIVDNSPGERNRYVVGGNSVQIRHDGFVMDLDHFQYGSIVVHRGDKLKAGDLIGRCGNSGNSSEPHLHFQIQSESGFDQGVALRPVFDLIAVNGQSQSNHAPVKSEHIANISPKLNQAAAAMLKP